MSGIIGFGAYIPRLRLSRQAAVGAMAWLAPALIMKAKGCRSMANWDEDSLTMAVEACRDALGPKDERGDDIGALYFASTTMPFADRQNSAVVLQALTLPREVSTVDITSSMRAGTSALLEALTRTQQDGKSCLVAASDRRHARAASTQELNYGDAGAALIVGADDGVAKFLGASTITEDFVDHFRGANEEFDYHWEERWIRDEGLAKIVPEAVASVLKKASLQASDIDHFILPSTIGRAQGMIAKLCGIKDEAVSSPLAAELGEAGTAHALVMLVRALEEAQAGQKILVLQFGSGCNALLFEATGKPPIHQGLGVGGHLALGQEENNYMKFLVFNGLVEWEKGMRAEQDKKTALTTLYRNRDMILGLVGGRCTKTGVVQFPMTRISVNPNDPAVDTQEPYKFAERQGKVLSWSGDYLSFGISPPNHYGMITFDEGGRIMLDITDVSPGDVETGMDVRMVFRVKDIDANRGFTRYFWKAVPARGA